MRRRGLLLDRDGVIIRDHGYVNHPDRVEFMPDIFALLQAARDKGYRLAIITNQAGVAHGYFTEDEYHAFTQHLLAELSARQIEIDLVLASFAHHKAVIDELQRGSYWRKPNPGMILEAAHRLNLDLSRSIMIGDRLTDIGAARAAGVAKKILFPSEVTEPYHDVDAKVIDNLHEVMGEL